MERPYRRADVSHAERLRRARRKGLPKRVRGCKCAGRDGATRRRSSAFLLTHRKGLALADTTKTSGAGTLQVTNLDHIVLWVKDLDVAKHFYVDFLGFTVDREHLGPDTGNSDPLDADYRCFLRCGAHQVGLFQQKGPAVEGRAKFNHLALALEAGTRSDVHALLEANGIAWHGRANDPGCVYIQDPDGHTIQLLTPLEG